MNREKKQLVVVGVLVLLVVSVGAFQFTRKDPPAPPAAKKEEAKDAKKGDKPEVPTRKYPDLFDLPPKDPFQVAAFVDGDKPPIAEPLKPATTPVPVAPLNKPGKDKLDHLQTGGGLTGPLLPAGNTIIEPAKPPVPVFGYALVGIVEGNHPMAVFQDEKGNQQLVEAGQSVGSSATVTQISRGKVRVKFNEKTLVLNVGGNPNAK